VKMYARKLWWIALALAAACGDPTGPEPVALVEPVRPSERVPPIVTCSPVTWTCND
jgi:hypothetical protein